MADQMNSRRIGPDTRRIGSGISIVFVGPLTLGWENLDQRLHSMEDVTVYQHQEAAAQIIGLCKGLAPCVPLINLRFLEALTGLRFVTLVNHSDSVHIVVLAETEDLPVWWKVLQMGCKGLLMPNLAIEINVSVISKVRESKIWMSRTKQPSFLQENVRVNDEVKLTSREKEILCLVGRGRNNQQIADALFITHAMPKGVSALKMSGGRLGLRPYGAFFTSRLRISTGLLAIRKYQARYVTRLHWILTISSRLLAYAWRVLLRGHEDQVIVRGVGKTSPCVEFC